MSKAGNLNRMLESKFVKRFLIYTKEEKNVKKQNKNCSSSSLFYFMAVFHSFIAAEGAGGERLNGEIIKWQISTFSFNKLSPNGS